MDLQNHAETNLGTKVETYGGYVNKAIDLGTGLFAEIRNKAKAKTAKAIADGGGYDTLSDFQKMLLAKYYPNDSPGSKTPGTTPPTPLDIKAYLPYILGVLAIGIAIWYVTKKVK